jgi:antitoxin component YwqK of YwqJK toxin-antitoxin module
MSVGCGSPTEKPIAATSVAPKPTPIAPQARTPIAQQIDAGVVAPPAPPPPPPPKITCSDDTRVIAAPYPDPTWFCARADGTRHGAFITLFPDREIEIEGSYKDGKLDGAWQRRYPGGAIAETGTYVAGMRDGTWRQLGPSGAVLGEYTLTRGTGTQKRWLDDGPLYSETTLKNGVPHGLARIFERNGTVVVSAKLASGKLHGAHVVGSKNVLRIEESFVRGTRRGTRKIWQYWALLLDEAFDAKGKQHGAFAMWRDRRTPRVQGTFDHGKRTGTWTWTDASNKKEREGQYADDRKTGTWIDWIDEKVVFQGSFTDGKPNGEFVYFDRNGTELGRFTMTDGTGTMLTFHPNQRVATSTQMVSGLKEGAYEEVTARGRRIVTGRYLADQRHGTWRDFTELGVITLEQRYKRGKLDGAWKKFVDGKVAVEATYKDGLVDGTYTEYRAGKPSLTGQFAADKRTGIWSWYDADGSVTLTATYKDGVLDGPWRQLLAGGVLDGQMSGGRRAGTWIQTDRAGQKQSVTYQTP